MRQLNDPAPSSFEILAPPRWLAPMVFNSPHSGHALPQDFRQLSNLNENQLRYSEDSHVDELFAGCLDAGAPLMRSLLSRSYLDLNREPYELDARMFRERLPAYVNCASPRVASGLGTIPRTVGDGVLIYNAPLDFAEAIKRIETVYRPYHRALGALLDEAYNATGTALLVDCHSMPSSAVTHMRPSHNRNVDIVLGDRYGSACEPEITSLIETHMQTSGLMVSRNKPYSGGFFTENHGRPRHGRHAVQIEVNRALYMNETSHEPSAEFAGLQTVFTALATQLAEWLKTRSSIAETGLAAAAE
jgi:N-formylglutamate amidohydrolase